MALNTAFYDPGLVLIVAPAQRQSVELFRKVRDTYNAQEDAPKIVNESTLRMEMDNGSRIIALPGTEATIRGYSAPKLVLVDEASRVEDSLFTGLRPMLATNQGRMVLLTTPYGKRGFFYEAWAHGEGWKRTRITADQCPRIDPEWLAEERKIIGEWQYRQEYLCEFVDTDESFFSSDLIEAAFQPDLRPLWT
jgi:hypothetical protein